MKNNKGFTLVEIIAVIVILVVVSLIAVPAVLHMIKRNKEIAYDAKLDLILKQSKQYARDHEEFLNNSEDIFIDKVCNSISVKELRQNGYLKEIYPNGKENSTITDPKTGQSIDDMNIIVYINSNNPYSEVEKYNGSIAAFYARDSWCNHNHPSTDFEYTGDEQTFTINKSGFYRLQVWGAQGGSCARSENMCGGVGGYAEGVVHLDKDEEIYIYVGGSGDTGGLAGGFNGGGAGINFNGGGGGTDFRVEGNTLYHRIVVAGGGGSGGRGGDAGGYSGSGEYSNNYGGGVSGGCALGFESGCGTQTSAGSSRAGFGYGEPAQNVNNCGGIDGSGGGGWYGGAAGSHGLLCMQDTGGSGGSAFVYDGTNTVPEGYAVLQHVAIYPKLLSGISSRIPTYDNTSSMMGNKGNGFAKITLVSPDPEE